MRRKIKLITILLTLYLASYFYYRKAFETSEGDLVTLYDEDSLTHFFAFCIHAPLSYADTSLTNREIKMGNWREGLSPELMEHIKKENNGSIQKDD